MQKAAESVFSTTGSAIQRTHELVYGIDHRDEGVSKLKLILSEL
jgi:hypothetical protein